MEIECDSDRELTISDYNLSEHVIVPIGGGKDSIVTLETLKNNYDVYPFVVNNNPARTKSIIVSGVSQEKTITANRTITDRSACHRCLFPGC